MRVRVREICIFKKLEKREIGEGGLKRCTGIMLSHICETEKDRQKPVQFRKMMHLFAGGIYI